MRIPEGEEREEGTEEIFEAIMTENSPQVNVRFQTTDPGSLEKYLRISTRHIIVKWQEIK